jgi:hypothetical protein
MPNLFKIWRGIKENEIPFTPIRPIYLAPGLELTQFDDEKWLYEGENKVFFGGLYHKNKWGFGPKYFIGFVQSTVPHKQLYSRWDSDTTTITVNNIEVVIHRQPLKHGKQLLPDNDKRQIYVDWYYNGIYFSAYTVDIPLNETVKVIASMIT